MRLESVRVSCACPIIYTHPSLYITHTVYIWCTLQGGVRVYITENTGRSGILLVVGAFGLLGLGLGTASLDQPAGHQNTLLFWHMIGCTLGERSARFPLYTHPPPCKIHTVYI
jgi:hypothetical protein